jgi:hypothetical protein
MKREGLPHGVWMVALAGVLAACGKDATGPAETAPGGQGGLELALRISSTSAKVGDRVVVAVDASAPETVIGIQGALRYDPAQLTFVGQDPASAATFAMVNDEGADAGRLRYLATNTTVGLGRRVAPLVFQVRGPNYAGGLRYEFEAGVIGREVEVQRARVSAGATEDRGLTVPGNPRKLGVYEWAALMDPSIASRGNDRVSYAAGQRPAGASLNYGDINLSGTFTTVDVSTVGRAALGRADAPIIIGTDSVGSPTGAQNRDMAIAANVRPSLAGQPVGGVDPNRVLNVSDVQALQRAFTAGGVDVPLGADVPSVGTPIRESDVGGCSNLVVAAGTLTGNISWDVPRPCFVQLDGIVRIGDEAGAAGTLTIGAGTLVRGNNAINPSALFITRNGRIIAIGTQTDPIEMSCTGALAEACWGGLFIAGNATVNELQGGLATSPAIPGRQTGGANQRQGEGGAPPFGGNSDADSSGVLRYVRIEGAGFELSPNNELNCLTLGGVGYGTDIDHVQCHRGSDDGFEMFGGTVDLRFVYASLNQDDGFDGSFGWNGRAQYVIITSPAGSDTRGLEFDNTETSTTYTNTPATSPELYNFTVLGNAAADAAIVLRRGTSPELGHFLVSGWVVGLDVRDGATCNRLRGGTAGIFTIPHDAAPFDSIAITRSRFALQGGSVGDGDAEAGCLNDPNTERNFVAIAAFNNDTTPATPAALLVGPTYPGQQADFRPLSGQLGVVGASLPGARANHIDFDVSGASFIGAVPTAPATLNTIPWYAGWTRTP